MRLIRACIDTQALRSNLQVLRERAPHSRIMAVVKANAYGHGLVPAALALGDADAFAVARIEEAVALRGAGVQQPIVLLEGVINAEQLAAAAELDLELVVHDTLQVALLEASPGPHRYALWLKVDTGMNRLGFRPEEFAAAWSRLGALRIPPLCRRVLTHLACADERDHAANAGQLERFATLTDQLGAERSIANSAALLNLPSSHVEWVRPGLALYGISPFSGQRGTDFGLRPVMRLESSVIAVRQVRRGETVGYGAAWRAARESCVAILAGGYGDGLLRSLPNGAPVIIGGQRAPLAGRVSMDMIAVDVTDLPPVRPGDRAELWGGRLPVEEVAAAAGTLAYELLCGVSQRVPVELV
ncbi:MAG: alanine racemase [Gammaproteobacteria bacterium]|nr:alanine racemase [Gammaproteobacteria bacterium]